MRVVSIFFLDPTIVLNAISTIALRMQEDCIVSFLDEIVAGNLENTTVCIFEFKVPIAANRMMFVYKIQVNPIDTILKYGDYYHFMDR